MDIKNLKDLLQSFLRDDYRFISYTCKGLLPPGENYGSVMLSIHIKVENSCKQEELIQCVAKTVPPSQVVWDVFNTPVTFKKEIGFYKVIIPTLNEFGQSKGVDNIMNFFATCFAARISLDSQYEKVDNDAVLLLENLKTQGYVLGDRFNGFDLKTSKLVIAHLATLHATPIAFKLEEPDIFEKKIRPLLRRGIEYIAPDEMLDDLIKHINIQAAKDIKCLPLLERVELGIRRMKDLYYYSKFREPFATILHSDFWLNNMLIKYKDDIPDSVKFVDFQLYDYGSPLRDLVFFLYSSVKLEVLEENVDELLKFYYDELTQALLRLKCKINDLTFQLIMEEIKQVAFDVEFSHIMFMLTPIFTLKGEAVQLQEWSPNSLAPDDESKLHENYQKILHFTILDFAKRQWI